MEVVQMKKGGKVKRRRAKPRQPTQTQRQVVNINMGGGGGGARIGSTHTFSQPPEFYNVIREIPNQPVNYGNNPIRGTIQNQEPFAATSVASQTDPMAQLQFATPMRATAQPQYMTKTGREAFEYDDPIRLGVRLGTTEPYEDYHMTNPEFGAVAATASSSASSSSLGRQLPLNMEERARLEELEFKEAAREQSRLEAAAKASATKKARREAEAAQPGLPPQ